MRTQNDRILREHVLELLKSKDAHADFETAVKDVPANMRGKRPSRAAHSPWEVLEHMRITQWDILEFTRNAKHVSPEFPAGCWPKAQTPPDEKAWEKNADAFRRDLKRWWTWWRMKQMICSRRFRMEMERRFCARRCC